MVFIQIKILPYPHRNGKLNLSQPPHHQNLMGQFGQPYEIEKYLKLQKIWKKIKKRKQPGFFIEAGACDGELKESQIISCL